MPYLELAGGYRWVHRDRRSSLQQLEPGSAPAAGLQLGTAAAVSVGEDDGAAGSAAENEGDRPPPPAAAAAATVGAVGAVLIIHM